MDPQLTGETATSFGRTMLQQIHGSGKAVYSTILVRTGNQTIDFSDIFLDQN